MDSKKIVLVEDNPDDIVLTRRALTKNNILNEMVVLTDGAAALDYFFGAGDSPPMPPAVVLLDLKLPKVDGLEVLRRLKGDPVTRLIPIVVLSSSQEERDLVESYGIGANSYVVKPMDFNRYSESVRLLGQYWLHCNQTPNC
jgi:two-component system response regulator